MTVRNHHLALFAVITTIVGLSQTLIYKMPPVIPFVLWFPSAIIIKRITHDDFAMLFAALIQFPAFTLTFGLGYRRWPPLALLAVLLFVYLVLVATAFWILHIERRTTEPNTALQAFGSLGA